MKAAMEPMVEGCLADVRHLGIGPVEAAAAPALARVLARMLAEQREDPDVVTAFNNYI